MALTHAQTWPPMLCAPISLHGQTTCMILKRWHGTVQGVGAEAVKQQAESLLAQVGLTAAATIRTGRFSGGMRRRLSVAIALLGAQCGVVHRPTSVPDDAQLGSVAKHCEHVVDPCSHAGRRLVLI